MSAITIQVDGKQLQARAGEMLISVTDRNDIYIPRFCYHEKLSVAANCRMCLVEVEKAPKPMPACATPVMDGMKVFTRSELAREAQQGTLEFLLINHPLDCPVCDQGGECPLQDQAMGYGDDNSRFLETKRAVPNYDIGPLVATEMTRCIHCTRCVRFGEEIAGVVEMGAPGRGENVKISTFLSRTIDSEVSGNIIDLCPVGALTSKPYRFSARSWELRDHPSISPHDCVGANINIQTLRDVVERVLPIDNAEINECWIADRDRYSYEAVNSGRRLTSPMIRENQTWREVDWETALEFAASGLKAVKSSGSANDIGGIAGATSTLEEFYLLQKLMRGFGSENIDHRLQQCDFRDDDIAPAFPASEVAIKDYSRQKTILLVGSNIRKEQPLLSLKIREGWKNSITKISTINSMDYDLNFGVEESGIGAGYEFIQILANFAMTVGRLEFSDPPGEIRELSNSDDDMEQSARNLIAAGSDGLIILGGGAQQHRDASVVKAIANWIADTVGCSLAVLTAANGAAGHVARCLPGPGGMNAAEMFARPRKAMILLGSEPQLDSIDGGTAASAMKKADFVVSLNAFQSDAIKAYSHVLLPVAAFTESAGTFINCEARAQTARVAAHPKGQSRPAWKVLRVLGNFLQIEGFKYITLDDVTREINAVVSWDSLDRRSRLRQWRMSHPVSKPNREGLLRLTDMPMYRGDITLRNADALQQTADNPPPAVSMNAATADKHSLAHGDNVSVQNGSVKATLPLTINNRVPNNCIYIPAGFDETTSLGGHITLSLEKV